MYNYVMLSGDKTYKHSSVDTVRWVINHLGLRSTLHCLQSIEVCAVMVTAGIPIKPRETAVMRTAFAVNHQSSHIRFWT